MRTKLLTFLLLLLAMSMPASAYDFMVNGLCYNYNDDGTTVTLTYQQITNPCYVNLSGSVTIPSNVTYSGKTYTVTAISDHTFCECTGLTSVTIPSSVTKIENIAFYGCSNLQVAVSKIVNPQNVTYTNTTNYNLIFSGVPATSTLYVPKGTFESYQLEQYNNRPNPWLAFGSVTELVDGDVNLDGNITSADVTALYNYLLYGDSNHIATSDTNGDGIITIADITTLYNRILGN